MATKGTEDILAGSAPSRFYGHRKSFLCVPQWMVAIIYMQCSSDEDVNQGCRHHTPTFVVVGEYGKLNYKERKELRKKREVKKDKISWKEIERERVVGTEIEREKIF